MYMYIGFPLSITNVVLINVVITCNYSIYPRMKQNTSGPSKNSPSQKKDLKSQTSWNSVSWIGSTFQQLPSKEHNELWSCSRQQPGMKSRSPFSCLSCLISMSQKLDLLTPFRKNPSHCWHTPHIAGYGTQLLLLVSFIWSNQNGA